MLATGLHPLERQVLPHLSKHKDQHGLEQATGMQAVEVVRALMWLDNKGIIKTRNTAVELVSLGKNGQVYITKRLPELRFLEAVSKKSLSIPQVPQEAGIDPTECNACLGLLRKIGAIGVLEGKIKITSIGTDLLNGKYPAQEFLKTIKEPRSVATFSIDESKILTDLKSRKDIIEISFDKTITYATTELGQELLSQKLDFSSIIDKLSPELLASGAWKGKTIRPFDVCANVPRVYTGRRQHYKSFLDMVRFKFASLGFTEMRGPLVENDFWDMDALFMPQFHSARDIHQAYYVKEPNFLKVDPKLLAAVRACHETGGKTGSKGWRYKFDEKRSQRTLLRTQGTACSARMLASPNLKIPGKYFGITKNFRYDVIDATHLPDFFQTEGIVVEEGLTFGHLKGILELFAKEFAHVEKIKLKPGYFPFTEPSVELHAKHPQLGWIELGGAGMFRPELLEPFGIKVPVIAWGIGIDRIGMFNMGINDIRDLYSHDLEKLRNARMV